MDRLFQSTRLYKPRLIFKPIHQIIVIFQSTRLYKPRLSIPLDGNTLNIFQSTRLYKPRPFASSTSSHLENFNPRGCISLDEELADDILRHGLFQSTRLYKPRLVTYVSQNSSTVFQSTRLYKPRLQAVPPLAATVHFNPRGCISLDKGKKHLCGISFYFNPRGCISLDCT